ncbi:MAG: glutaredoxin family protein [Caldilineaceae bacterium]|nr:glutaredoxin family protein [Caldilineaceae bacterium]
MQVVLFTKANCQLCDAIKYELLDLQAEYAFEFHEEFVETSSDAQEEEHPGVPRVHFEREGRVILCLNYPVKQVELRRAVRAAMKERSGRQP